MPFGRAFRYNLSSKGGIFKNFRPCMEETKVAKKSKTTKNSIRFLRAIKVLTTKSRERGRESEISWFCWCGRWISEEGFEGMNFVRGTSVMEKVK